MDSQQLTHPQRLAGVRQRWLEGAPLPAGLLPDPVARSWERSREAGLSPWEPRLHRPDAPVFTLDDRDRQLGACVQPEIERLWQVFGGQSWTLFCVNTRGVIVQARHAGSTDTLGPLQIGRRIHEADIGTTAPSCTLAEDQPVVLHGWQHYLSEFERFFCVSMPVHDVQGELIGALDITGIGERNAQAVLDQLRLAAMATENRLFGHLDDCQILSLQHDPRLIGTPLQGLLALDGDGRIRAANATARRLLGLSGSLAHWHQCFVRDPSPDAQRHTPGLVQLNDGSSLYAHRVGTRARAHSGFSHHDLTPLGRDPQLNRQFEAARKAFGASIPVLLLGETGTGKEVFARALHDDLCPDAPFVAINCSAIPESLIEAELFGYSDGTFTGARKGGASGRLEEAHGGTLLLDEIGDMPAPLQTRLLRVLQERRVTRLGSSQSRPLSVRLISATHCDLPALIGERRFREDLYYRLNGFSAHLPALRERKDLIHLIDSLLRQLGSHALHSDSLACLQAQHWPGNIRQLEQTLRLACALAEDGSVILPEHLCGLSTGTAAPVASLKAVQQRTIEQTLQAHGGNISATAHELGISRTTLYKKLREGRKLT